MPGQPYVRISSGNVFTTLDITARNPLGIVYVNPINPASLTTATKGYGAPLVVKYVYYNSTTNPAPVAAPAPVYWIDESFTAVSGNAAEAYSTTGTVSIAGYLLPNTTSISGLTNVILNQSYCFICVGGLLAAAYAPTTVTGAGIGASIIGVASGNWASSTVAAGTYPGARAYGVQYTAIASSACDVLVGGLSTFWGS